MNFKLRAWAPEDSGSLIKYAGNPQITRFMSDGFSTLSSSEGAKNFINFVISNPNKIYRAIEVNGEAVGGIGITVQTDIYRKNAELGYWLAEPFWGKGFISKTIPMIVAEAFDALDITRIFAKPFHTNVASRRVLEKSGFKLETIFEKAIYKNEEYLDEYVYAIRKPITN